MKLLPRSAEWLGLEEQFLGNKEARSANTVQPINRHLSSLFWPGSRGPTPGLLGPRPQASAATERSLPLLLVGISSSLQLANSLNTMTLMAPSLQHWLCGTHDLGGW